MKKNSFKIIILSLFSIFVMVFGYLFGISVNAENPYTAPTLNEDNFYELSSVNDLNWFSYEVNTNKHYKYNAILKNDIVMNDVDISTVEDKSTLNAFNPIGDHVKDSASFQGIFDGNNHKVSGVYINGLTQRYIGFFGEIKKATIYNLTIENFYYESTPTNTSYFGGLVGYCYLNSSISNCNVSGILSCDSSYVVQMGGIVGYGSGVTKSKAQVSHSTSNVTLNVSSTKQSNIGGAIGYAYCVEANDLVNNSTILSNEKKHTMGGIVGYAYGSSFKNCKNNSSITASLSNVGGIAGQISYKTELVNCINYADLSSTNAGGICGYSLSGCIASSENHGEIFASKYAGGIVGYSSGKSVQVNASDNYGECHGEVYAGGILGYSGQEMSISYSRNYAKISGGEVIGGIVGGTACIISTCENYGEIQNATKNIGGIAGSASTIKYCLNQGKVKTNTESVIPTGIAYSAKEILNTYNIGEIELLEGQKGYAICGVSQVRNRVLNCYFTNTNVKGIIERSSGSDAKRVETSDFSNGKICYLLNEEPYYMQTIGVDLYPIVCGDSHFVYRNCQNGTPSYSNDYQEEHHNFINGICKCGECEKPEVALDGTYLIKNAGNLIYFANEVNHGNNSINGKLMSDITINEDIFNKININGFNVTAIDDNELVKFKPIGNPNDNYLGKFDGNFYTISGLFMEDYEVFNGLFGVIGSTGIVKNLNIKDSIILIDRTQTKDFIPYISGIVYGMSVGLVDNVNVNNSKIGIKEETSTISFDYTHTKSLMYAFQKDSFITYYTEGKINNKYNKTKTTQSITLEQYILGEGVFSNPFDGTYKDLSKSYSVNSISFSISTIVECAYFFDGITEIASHAFNSISPKSVILPNTLIKINEYGITGISTQIVLIPDSVTTIDSYAFSYSSIKGIILPTSITSLGWNYARPEVVFYKGTKEQYDAIDLYKRDDIQYVFEFGSKSQDIGQININFIYNDNENPYLGGYLQYTCGDIVKKIPITNTKSFNLSNCPTNQFIYLEILSPLGNSIKDLGSIILTEDVYYSYSTDVLTNVNETSIIISVKDESGKALSSGYRVDLYNGQDLVDSKYPSNNQVAFKNAVEGDYIAKIILTEDLIQSYLAVPDLEFTLGTNNVVKTITLQTITAKTVTFTVKNEEEEPVEDALIVVDEVYSSRIHRFYSIKTNDEGTAVLDLHSCPINYRVSKMGYFIEEGTIDSSEKSINVSLSSINGVPVLMNILLEDNYGLIKEIANISQKNISIYNKTKDKNILDYYYIDQYIYLPLSQADEGDVISFTVSDISNTISDSVDIIIEDNNIANVILREMSYFEFANVYGYIHIFDDNDNLVASFNASKMNKSPHLSNGTYKILIIDKELGCHISSLTDLNKYSLNSNENYYLLTKELNGSIVQINNYSVDSNINLVTNNIIDMKNSYTILGSSSLSVGEYQTVRIVLNSVKDFTGRLEITIPQECVYQNMSLRVDSKDRDVEIVGNKLYVNITDKDTSIRYTLRCNKESEYVEAKARILANDTFYPVPFVSYSIDLIKYSINVDANQSGTLMITGRTLIDSTIELYDNDKLIAKTLSGVDGTFSFKEALNDKIQNHRIYFKVLKNENVVAISEKRSINLNQFEIRHFYLTAANKVDLVRSNKVAYSYSPSNPKIIFNLELSTVPQSIDLILYLVKGKTKVIPLTYNESTNTWDGIYKAENTYDMPKNIGLSINSGQKSTYLVSYQNITLNTEAPTSKADSIEQDKFSINSIGPTEVATADEVTFRILGSMLSTNTSYRITNSLSFVDSTNVLYVSPNEAYVTFNLSNLKSGNYNLRASNQGTFIDTPLTINSNLLFGNVGYELNVSPYGSINQELSGSVVLSNYGYSDCYTRVLVLQGTDVVFSNGKNTLIDVVSCNGLCGTLLAREEAVYQFNYRISGSKPQVTCKFIDRIGSQLINSPDISKTGEAAVNENLYAILGSDSVSYQKAIAKAANYLATIGYKSVSLEDCEKIIAAQAKGYGFSEALFAETIIERSHFKLYRVYNSSVERHLEMGMLGYGFVTNFEMKFEKENDTYVLRLPEERVYFYQYLGSYYSFDGKYEASVDGDNATVLYDGTVYRFENGRLVSVANRGIVIYKLTYDSSKLVKIEGLFDVATFTYSGEFVDKIYLNGELYESYINARGFLMAVRGNIDYNYSYLLNERGAKYGLLSKEEIDDDETSFDYDSLGKVIRISKGNNVIEYTYYDGLLVKMASKNGINYLYYDYAGNIVKEITSLGLMKRVTYEDGYVNTYINNLVQRATLDDKSRVTVFYFADGTYMSYEYSDTETIIRDAKNNIYRYRYDSNKSLTEIVYPDGTTESFTYLNGLISSKKNRDNTQITYTYDIKGRTTKEVYSDGSYIEYEYDSSQNVSKIKDDTYSMSFAYNAKGLLEKTTYKDGKTLEYQYDEKSRVVAITDPLGRVTRYEYDSNNQIYKVLNNSNSTIAEYTYDSFGRVTKQKNTNSSYTLYTYNGAYVESIKNYGKSNNLLSSFTYRYNMYGLIECVETLDDKIYYHYDDLGRIVAILSNNLNAHYGYDAVGNRIVTNIDGEKVNATFNTLNEYVTIGNKTLAYNQNGYLSTITVGGQVYSYTYNAKNQLVHFEDGVDTYDYTYDFFGNRDSITLNGEITKYYYTPNENGKLVASQKGTKGISYIYGHELIGAYTNSKMYYYDYDLLGNVIEIVNTNGVVQNSYSYNANFTVTSKQEAISNPFTYCGKHQYFDDGSNLYKVGSRYVLKEELAFTSPDKNACEYGLNLYQYAGGNFTNLIDENGEVGVVAGVLIAAGVGAGLSFVSQVTLDVMSGELSSFGDYVGGAFAGAFGGAAGAVITLSGGAGIAASATINATGAMLGTYVGAFVDYTICAKDFEWSKLHEKARSNARTGMVSGAFGSMFGKAINADALGGLVIDVELGGLKMIYDRITGSLTGENPRVDKDEWDFMDEEGDWSSLDEEDGWDFMDDEDSDYEFEVIPLVDPAGYVCEGVSSNRISDVKCTLYYSEVSTGKNAIIFSNDYWGQINPLYSDSEGKYAWDVPEGYWQVKFEKEGYFVAYSEWLPVPPIQLDVNVGLVSLYAPTVADCNLKKNEITFTFSQYMKVSDINSSKVKVTSNGKEISGTFSAVDAEASFEDATVFLAKTFKFIPTEEFNSLVTIEIDGALNYTNTPLEAKYSKSCDFKTNTPVNPDPDPDSPDPVNPEGEKGKDVNSSGLPVGAVVGISIGAVVVVAAIAAIVVFIVIKKKKSSARE